HPFQLFRGKGVNVIVAAHSPCVSRSSKQLIYRHAQHLAANVPQRLVDAGDRGTDDGAGAVEAVNVHGLPVMLDLHWILADQEIAEILDTSDDGGGFSFQRAFSPSDDALVGFELHEYVWSVRVRRQGDAEDLHSRNLHSGRHRLPSGILGGRGELRHEGAATEVGRLLAGVPGSRRARPSEEMTSFHTTPSINISRADSLTGIA